MLGQTISHYRILSKLGEGGMGVVYKAEDTQLKRPVALKFLPSQVLDNPAHRARLVHEAQAAAALRHPNLCPVHEIAEAEGQTFIVMAYIDGQSLKQRLAAGPLPVDEALDIARQVAEGLAKAHQQGIVHRDIKPANIMLDKDGTAVLTDFGLAVMEDATRLTRAGTTVGTVAYMAPEQIRGGEVDARSDQFALGVVLYEMLTGRLPFAGDREATLMHAILNEAPAPLTGQREDLPEGLQGVVDKALARDPTARYPDIQEFLADLQRLLQGQTVTVVARTRRSWSLRAIPTAVAGAILALAAVSLLRYIDTSQPQPAGTVRNRVAVLPFTVQGGEEIQYLGEGMVNLLGGRLDGIGELSSVPAEKILVHFKNRYRNRDPLRQNELAGELDAGYFVTGSVVEAGSQLSFSATLFRTGEPRDPVLTSTVAGTIDSILDLVEDLAADLLMVLFERPCDHVTPLAVRGTDSFVALRSYLTGEHHFRTGKFNSAVESFQAAVAADTSFGLAYYRLARAASFTPTYYNRVVGGGTLQKAIRYSEELPERTQDLLMAMYTRFTQNDPETALRLLRGIVVRYPDDQDANFFLGEVCQEYAVCHGPDRDLWYEEAEGAYSRVLVCEPDHLQTIIQLYMLAGDRQDPVEYLALAKRRLSVSPEGYYTPYLQTHIAFATGDTVAQRQSLEALVMSDDFLAYWVAEDMARVYEDFDAAEQIVLEISRPPREPAMRARARFILAKMAVAGGCWQEAQAHLDAAESHFLAEAIEARSVYVLVPELALSSEEIENVLQEVAALPEMYEVPWAAQVHTAYVSGLLMTHLGQWVAARQQVRELEILASEIREPGSQRSARLSVLPRNLAWVVEASLARVQGDPATALKHMEQIDEVAAWGAGISGPLTEEGWQYAHYLRAELLAESGQDREALRWYDTLTALIYRGPAHLRMGEIHERLDNAELAALHYRQFLSYWQHCEQPWQPMVAEIQQRLAQLEH